MKYYPVYFNITNRMCVVVGGGDIAERKIARLLECGASVVVVGKKLGPKLVDMKSEGKIKHIAGDYQEEHIRNAFLVIGATDRDDVNERIYRDAKRNGIPANIVDDPGRCDFILPSIFQQGDLQIAISTGGKSPALAKRLRLEMEKNYGPEYKTLLDIMGAVREKIITKGRPSEENKELFESLLNSDILRHIQEKNISKVKKIVNDLTGEDIDGQ